jgi:molecular chaperone DnaK (HSP70)
MSPIVMEIMNTMREVFTQSGYKAEDVDEVVLTGGTAQFYLIQEQFKLQFGEKKLIEHDVYQSVVGGLSQYALTQL